MIKKAAWGLLTFLILITLIIFTTVAPIDDAPLDTFSEVTKTYETIGQLGFGISGDTHDLKAGWATINITPRSPIDMAGYGARGPYTSVADSLFAKIIVLDNGKHEAIIISLDLLMFPRIIKDMLQELLMEQGITKDQVFLSATHTHSGFGNWEKSIAGELIFGTYNEENSTFLVQQILSGINKARDKKAFVQIGFDKIDANELVFNRLSPKNGTKDPFLRIIHLKNENGEKGLLVSFSGHAVNLDADIWELSRDYPGVLVKELERDSTINFAMFCAGMVASHNIDIDLPKGDERIMEIGMLLSQIILAGSNDIIYDTISTLEGMDIPIELPPSQLRLTKNIRMRNWVFQKALGPLQANVKVLMIGDVLMIGMPCDFSGELSVNNQLDQLAEKYNKQLFITSFNGNYVGYITEDKHYLTCNHDEVKTLNWVGPNKGAYFTEIIKKIIAKAD